jgi:hypothetical protein
MELHKKIAEASMDLLFLLEKHYPRKASIELVGNRYELSSQDRMVLYRGVFSRDVCTNRIQKRWSEESPPFTHCVIDGYNVCITVESYLQGKLVFRALDGFIRDVSGVYGSHSYSDQTSRTADLIFRSLQQHLSFVSLFTIFLDYPVSKSGEFASFLRERAKQFDIPLEVEVVKSPDSQITRQYSSALCASSDSVIIDAGDCCVDIPDLIFSRIMGKRVPDLQVLLTGQYP